jgi:tetratricopeptide (TPR) repeat protein
MNHRDADKETFLWKKILLFFLGLFLVLVTLEIGLRVGGFIMLSAQEHRNLRSIQQNGEFRIMCLGESTTQGQYPPYLEEILNQRNLGVKISVIDKGLTGTNSLAIRLRLEADLDKYQPDIVVTMMGGNDRKTMYYQDIPESDTWIFRHCRVYRFGRLLFMQAFKKLGKKDIYSLNKPMQVLKTSYPAPDKPHEVKQPLEQTVKSGPENNFNWVRSGWRHYSKGELVEAEQAFKKAIDLDPKNDAAYTGLGHIYKDQAKNSEEESAFRKAIELNPKSDAAYTGLGGLYKDQGKYVESETLLKKAIELNPRNDSPYAELGRLYNYQKRYAESEQALHEALRLNPKDDAVYVVLSWVYRDQEKFTEAEQILNKAVELNPKYDPAYVGLGQVYKTQKRFTEAEQALKKALELNPQNMLAYGGLATIYGEMGKEKLSKEYADKLNNLSGKCYNSATIENYRKLKQILDQRRVKLVCVQYPMRSIRPLRNIFQQENVIFVDNEKIFKDAVKKEGYNKYFRDMFGGDFGHCTEKGNWLLAENIADVISKEIFGK